MDNWAIYNYINREGSGALRNESLVSSETVEVNSTVRFTGAALGGTAPYQYAFYYRREDAASWTVKSNYGAAATVYFTPQYVGRYLYKVNVKDSKGTVKSKIFVITSTAATNENGTSSLENDLFLDSRLDLTVENGEEA